MPGRVFFANHLVRSLVFNSYLAAKFFTIAMQQDLKEIKLKFRKAMNGIVSHHMRIQGADYKINFGLTLPLLKQIAAETRPDAQLATELWNDTSVRESMMLAPMVYPVDKFTETEADRWLNTMPNTEIADICCKFLFSRLPFALQKACHWSHSDKPLQQYTAFQLASAWLIAHPGTPDASSLEPVTDAAINQAIDKHDNRSFAAVNMLKQAMHHDTLASHILSSLQAQAATNEKAKPLLDDLTEEQLLFREFSGRDSH